MLTELRVEHILAIHGLSYQEEVRKRVPHQDNQVKSAREQSGESRSVFNHLSRSGA